MNFLLDILLRTIVLVGMFWVGCYYEHLNAYLLIVVYFVAMFIMELWAMVKENGKEIERMKK